MYNVTLIPGDGIGPSIMEVAVQVLEATGVKFNWDTQLAGMAAVEKFDSPIPFATLESIRKNRLAFKGPLTTPVGGGYRSVNVAMRQEFELFANVRPAVSYEGVASRYDNVNILMIRENTEGLYAGIEHSIKADGKIIAAESTAIITRFGSENVIRYAFEYVRKVKRKRLTLVHKANILKATTGLFLEIGKEISKEFPDVEFNDKIVDACAMQMVLDPSVFDVIITTNLFGDILSDLAAGLIGGLGLTPGANIGKTAAIFEAVHGSAPDIVGKNVANPVAVINGGIMMLEYLGELDAAKHIDTTLKAVIKEGKFVTPDLNKKSTAGTKEFGAELVRRLRG